MSSTPIIASTQMQLVGAGAVDQVLGTTGATGDYLYGLHVVPETVSPGSISIKDGPSGATWEVFNGGTGSVGTKTCFFIPINGRSLAGAWRVSVGINVHIFAEGIFTP